MTIAAHFFLTVCWKDCIRKHNISSIRGLLVDFNLMSLTKTVGKTAKLVTQSKTNARIDNHI